MLTIILLRALFPLFSFYLYNSRTATVINIKWWIISRTQIEEASTRKVKTRQQCGKVCEYSHLAAAARVSDRGLLADSNQNKTEVVLKHRQGVQRTKKAYRTLNWPQKLEPSSEYSCPYLFTLKFDSNLSSKCAKKKKKNRIQGYSLQNYM